MLTKDELNKLGFQRSAENKKYFYKPGFQMWVLEIEPGNTYTKVAIQEDLNSGSKDEKWEYFNSVEGIERYFERHAPVNPNDIEKLQTSFAAPYEPKLYNPQSYQYPSDGY